MNRWAIDIDPDIRQASTLPGAVYSDPTWFDRQKEQVLARTWHFAGDEAEVAAPGAVHPFSLLPGCLDEPLLFARRQDGVLHCLSNVCTHRGNLVVAAPMTATALRCRYHGRRFALDGHLLSSPEFEGARAFPTPADDLQAVPFGRFAGLLFAGIRPAMPFAELLQPVLERLGGWYPLDQLAPEPTSARDYAVAAPWALYCDNYLEGFHIPYVHAGLATSVVYATLSHRDLPVRERAGGRSGSRRAEPRAADRASGAWATDRGLLLLALSGHHAQLLSVGAVAQRGAPAGPRPHAA